MVAAGQLAGMFEYDFPVTLGRDFAGTVDALGDGVEGYSVGDRVFGVVMRSVLHDGSLAEYVTVSQTLGVAPLPTDVGDVEGGAVGLAGSAAIGALDLVTLTGDDTVLIAGATGGVGVIALQFAVKSGATVIATAKPGKEHLVRGLGAQHVVDYTGDIAAQVRAITPSGVQALLHFAGELDPLLDALADGGRLASTRGATQDAVGDRDVTATAVHAAPNTATLGRLASALADGTLTLPVQRRYAFDEVPQAFADFAAGTNGKLAVTVS
jgi:NADPH:quinone reductase